MAHSLFEPAPEPIGEKIWRHLTDLQLVTAIIEDRSPERSDPSVPNRAEPLDARGQQRLLQAALAANPIAK